MARQVMILSRLADDLLDLARLGQGKIKINRGVLSLNAVVAEAVEAVRPALQAKHHALEVVTAPDDPQVEGDPVRLKQIVINLLQNAIRYTPSGGSIEVTVAPAPDDLLISVADTGIGLAPEHLPHLFQRFYRADPSRDRYSGGSGLGLAIAAEYVRAHGGEITAESELGEGTTTISSDTRPRHCG